MIVKPINGATPNHIKKVVIMNNIIPPYFMLWRSSYARFNNNYYKAYLFDRINYLYYSKRKKIILNGIIYLREEKNTAATVSSLSIKN